ncbi:hypothetical protein [Thiocapsa bogorovii]|uniref:hypothetical protein n=1 Tax=Thiocapsa bogorovii TaxID=521689 RepID=UPI001E3587B8|nr:hypothetical protein [Thiocapsa bogorovii]UHD15043.1 hypothetical protein LT988_17385 [Thiocapsa bogorovii]
MEDELKSETVIGASETVWRLVRAETERQLEQALDTDPAELIALAWSKAQPLEKYADPERYPRDLSVIVHLGEHEMSWRLHPEIDIVVAEVLIRTFRFTIELTVEFKIAALTIQGGIVRSVAPGCCAFGAALKYGDITFKEEETPDVHFPGHIDLDLGVPIGGPRRTFMHAPEDGER